MTFKWAGTLGVALGVCVGSMHAEEVQWRPAAANKPSQPAASLGAPVTLGRPVAVKSPAPEPMHDPHLQQTSVQSSVSLAPPRPAVIRAQSPEYPNPNPYAPVPAQPGGIPATPEEQYNAGIVTAPPPGGAGGYYPAPAAAGPGFFDRCRDYCGSVFDSNACCAERGLFQSDHCFDNFISPVTNPFYFEDPRALTELRPIFMYQSVPNSNWVFRGGSIEWFGVQGRVAFTDRLSLSMTKLGFIAQQPNADIAGFDDEAGFSELWIGPKYTFIRNDRLGMVWAAGLQFQIATGPAKVFQDTDDLSLAPYLSYAQNFWKTSYGSMNFMNTTGYSFSTNSLRTDLFYTSFHLDYDVLDAHKWYPLVELNWRHYTQSGTSRSLDFTGADLYNFGSTGIAGHDDLTLAVGFRYKFTEAIQLGLANEWNLNGARDLMDYRLTFDMIFRY